LSDKRDPPLCTTGAMHFGRHQPGVNKKRLIPIFGLLLGSSLVDASAFAGSMLDGASVGGAPIQVPVSGQTRTAHPASAREDAASLKEIYSNFSSDENDLYDCCNVWDVSTARSDFQARYTLAMAFTPGRDALDRKIQLGLASVSGNNALSISLHADDGGMPGKALQTFVVTDMPPEGNCCEVEAAGPVNILVRKGRAYWVVAKANGNTQAGWNFNSIGASGPFAFNTGDGWQIRDLPLGAFRVLGE
jgi:hypothetical protein